MRLFRFFQRWPRQAGFTVLELIIGIGISGIMGAGVITAIYQIGSVNSIDNARVTAVKQVESALHYINRDVQMAQKVEANGQGYWLRLSWTTWDDNQNIRIEYKVDNGQLLRSYSVDNGTAEVSGVAQYITAVSATAPGSSQKAWVFQLTAQASSRFKQASETRQISIVPRPGS
jgi:type II secretory pathway component PulJ